ncbi:LuxR C-terminal-related transcriptional regulator [Oceanobacillus alkalisoli]|uniref:LuxR C-terminal-related transcriptional regulator n=1 Tax=Oceanobacillus alkalisoli TaxID=2925113 RepID=UPI001EEFD6D4|nr:response regulator transcription factor [Oceanobacillus alkalisoli]MCF3945012.1 response regulator transcription factor [Oceanobacillus alkalisoli]MCG5105330.1 response regulator transcription factor [Oceanobacillus alkalisoli]
MRVVIGDDLNVYSEGLQFIINAEADMEVVGVLHEQNNYLEQLERLQPSIILFNMKKLQTGMENAVYQYWKGHSKVKLVYLSPKVDSVLFYEWVKNKPDGILLQDLSPEKFISSVRDVHNDQYILSGKIAHELIKGFHQIDLLKKMILKESLRKQKIDVSLRELDILYLMFLKKKNQEIAKELDLPDQSVRYYVSKVYKTLKLKNRAETIRYLSKLINE